MRVFIVGKLGEVVKKMYELEQAIKEKPNTILLTELICYQEILRLWPVEDETQTHMACQTLKLCLMKLQEQEVLLRQYSNVIDYCKALDVVRDQMAFVNKLGKYIGPSPWMEIDDDMARPDNQDSSSSEYDEEWQRP